MNNKKKYVIALIAFAVCAVMFFFAIKAERMYANNVTKQDTNNEMTQNKAADTKNTSKAAEEAKKTIDEKNTAKDISNNISNNATSNPNNSSTSTSQENKTNTTSSNNSGANNGQTTAAVQSSTAKQNTQTTNPDEQPTFMFIDGVHGDKMILQKHVDAEGETVGYITCKLLDEAKIRFRTTGSSSTLYVAAIDGLEEKKQGPLSGWCYYVKKKGENSFHKPNIGCGQYVYEKGDVVVWRYVADGVHDGYSENWGK
ncbi:DUF4430 domain-containing protein [Clostridium magnum]|uniref:Transcobalamin-like C-terminal domain-containing protein n=1 Tax=Clostridium magnum DSM 2767 TaxID=1121326 RepID=A0A161WJV5_9CLOT|nr:DUF4430 domain-containing protein [Clostridium magnum]KZL92035.1 hypothetical protein CLMAG_18410 [Clostridium magnum DSM 2767]SHH25111.1 protein of unknown function [Clostridium magnum DSM 2767]